MIKYPARVEKEEKFFVCRLIDFPHLITQGETMDQLKYNARDILSLAIKYNLNRDLEVPPPSDVAGEDIIWVEPFPEIRRRMGHQKGCECPVCRNARGEREKTTERFEVRIPAALKSQVKEYCRRHKISEGKLTTEALEKFLKISA